MSEVLDSELDPRANVEAQLVAPGMQGSCWDLPLNFRAALPPPHRIHDVNSCQKGQIRFLEMILQAGNAWN